MNYFNYFSEIEETFNRRRGKFQFLSPVDWVLMEDWEKRGVPLHIVLRGIEKVFDNYDAKPKKSRSIKGLTYCREEIEAQYEEWAERQIGKQTAEEETEAESETFSDNTVREHILRVSAELKTAGEKTKGNLRDVIGKVLFRLENLAETQSDAEIVEGELSALEAMLDESLLKDTDEKILAEAEEMTTKNLSSYKNKMAGDVYQRTHDLMLLKTLRERIEIPRLS